MPQGSYDSSTVTQLPAVPNTADPELARELTLIYDAIRALNIQAKESVVIAVAAVSLSYGQFVRIYNSAGSLYANLASASTAGIQAQGFVSSQSVAAGASVAISLLTGTVTATGLTPGAKYYLQNTAGTIGTAPGTVSQAVGIAISSTTLVTSITL
jgi:hypothetical protein